jgi:hypothetical protein
MLGLIPRWLWEGAGIAILLAGGAWALHHAGYKAGMAYVEAQDAKALREAQARYAVQVEADAKRNEDAAHAYQAEIDRLNAAMQQPAPVIRLCRPASGSGAVPAPAGAAGGGTGASPGGGGVEVPGGVVAGPDIGPGLRLIAAVAESLAAEVRECRAAWPRNAP